MDAASFSLRTALAIVACLMTLPLIGSSIGTPHATKSNPDLTRLLELGSFEVGSGNYRKGLEIYAKVYQAASRVQDVKASLASLNNMAALHGALYESPQAGEAYLKARKLAELHGNWGSQTFLNFNLAF